MNTRVDPFSRQLVLGDRTQAATSTWLIAIACALAIVVVAASVLPSGLVLPGAAAGLYIGAVGTLLATRGRERAVSDKGWLVAGILFVAGIVASSASDIDGMLSHFG